MLLVMWCREKWVQANVPAVGAGQARVAGLRFLACRALELGQLGGEVWV